MLTDHTQITQVKHSKGSVDAIMSKFNTLKNIIHIYPLIYYQILSNMHKIGGAQFQVVNNHNAKFEYKGMKPVEVTDYTNQTP